MTSHKDEEIESEEIESEAIVSRARMEPEKPQKNAPAPDREKPLVQRSTPKRRDGDATALSTAQRQTAPASGAATRTGGILEELSG